MLLALNLQRITQIPLKLKFSQFWNASKIHGTGTKLFHSSFCKFKFNGYMTDQLKHQYAQPLVCRPLSFSQGVGDNLKSDPHLRLFSSESKGPAPSQYLMDFSPITWPNFVNSMKNWIYVFFIIKPYYERDFSLKTFTLFSKKAFIKVSEILSRGDFPALSEFVEDKALQEVKKNYDFLDATQRQRLAVPFSDVVFSFPYQVGIIMTENDGDKPRVFLEITMCYHIFHEMENFMQQLQKSDTPQHMFQNIDRMWVANYRFIKEVTKGTEGEWTINIINYFTPTQ